jgi:hypothetical protein
MNQSLPTAVTEAGSLPPAKVRRVVRPGKMASPPNAPADKVRDYDGTLYEEKKSGYALSWFRNPSGEFVPHLEHRCRPNTSKRYRNNRLETMKAGACKRDALILEDGKGKSVFNTVQTRLTQEEVDSAERAHANMIKLPPPSLTQRMWTFEGIVEAVKQSHKLCNAPILIDLAVNGFVSMKKQCNLKYETISDWTTVLRRLVKACPGKHVHEVLSSDLESLILRGETKRTKMKF